MSCNCNCNSTPITIPSGTPGAPGAAGTNGSDGVFGGYSAMWKFSTNTASGPSTTEIRFDNVNPAAVTEIYVHDNNASGTSVQAFLDSIEAFPNVATVYSSYIRVSKEFDNNTFLSAKLVGVADNGADFTLTIDNSTISTNGAFALNDNLVVSFSASGADGAAGSAGAPGTDGTNGTTVLFNDLSLPTSNAAVWTSLSTYITPINTLSTDGDRLSVKFIVRCTGPDAKTFLRILVNGNVYTTVLPAYMYTNRQLQGTVDLNIDRISNTSLAINSVYHGTVGYAQLVPIQSWAENPAAVGVIDCTLNTLPIAFQVLSDGVAVFTGVQSLVELHKV